ncbi:MAG: hypothetical protein ACYCRD_08635 [Leptospirillum sp.]
MKKAGIALVVFLLILADTLFWLHNNMDGLVKNAIEKYGSQMTGVRVRVASVEISAAQGTGIVRGLVVGNPSGFRAPYALKVGKIEMGMDISTITKPVVLIRKIAVDSPEVIYERGHGTTNFDAIERHIAKHSGPSGGNAGGKKNGKKLIVGKLSIRGAKVQATAPFMNGRTVLVNLPGITLHNIGKSEGGVPPGKLGEKVGEALKDRLETSVNFDAIARSMGNTLKQAGNLITGLFGK